jgi:hypothetical protein
MMRTRLPFAGALVVGAISALTACSSSTSGHGSSPHLTLPSTPLTSRAASAPVSTAPTAPAALPDACTLLTRAEAKALAGVTLNPPEDTPPTDANPIGMCEWNAPVTGPSGTVQLFVQHDVPRALQIDKAIHHKFRTIAGIGDQTLEEPENASIFVRKGAVWVYLTVPYSATPAQMESAARAIVARLP